MHRSVLLFLLLCSTTLGCESVLEKVRSSYRPDSPREIFVEGLVDAGLAESAMARAWIREGKTATSRTVDLNPPYRETGYADPSRPEAFGYRLTLERGQRLVVTGRFADEGSALFVDLFESMEERGLEPHRVASADSAGRMEYDVDRPGTYILRVQPEVLAAGRFLLEAQTKASIIFPVSGGRRWDIGSVFGDPREGGRREHHGVDIFARRGTPVVAIRDGRITSTKIGGLGGKTVWLRGNDGRSYYYAHLDRQLVQTGDRVETGDTLGLVGNTGNARTTPPHLHFGIYSSGPTDPWYFVVMPDTTLPRVRVEETIVGSWMRTRNRRVDLLTAPERRSVGDWKLDEYTPLRIVGAAEWFVRVRLPDGNDGYLHISDLEDSDTPITQHETTRSDVIQWLPSGPAPAFDRISPGSTVPVLGRFGEYLQIETPRGERGWIHAGLAG